MDEIFISEIEIEKVRHLQDIKIPLDLKHRKHLILTGKNGSGKTSVLEALSNFLQNAIIDNKVYGNREAIKILEKQLEYSLNNKADMTSVKNELNERIKKDTELRNGIFLKFYGLEEALISNYTQGNFILAHYKSDRAFEAEVPRHVEKVQLKEYYTFKDKPQAELIKFLIDLKKTEALAVSGGKNEKANEIKNWFINFENLLKRIYDNETIRLEFDEDAFLFHIREEGKEPFDFNTLSSGFAAILDIVADLMIRMEKNSNKAFVYDMQGIVLIDEIENHLHLELHKRIFDLFTTIFPNIQFIVTTHSPFVLNSMDNAVIYDLTNHVLVENGLSDIPYHGIVEGYFQASLLSDKLKDYFKEYRSIIDKKQLTDADLIRIAQLEMYLDKIPDYLALDITTEYQRLKLKLENREDI